MTKLHCDDINVEWQNVQSVIFFERFAFIITPDLTYLLECPEDKVEEIRHYFIDVGVVFIDDNKNEIIMNHLNDDKYLIRGNNISSVKKKIKKQTFILMLIYSIVAISIINILPKGVNQGVVIIKSNEEIDRLSKQVNSEMIGNKTIFSLDPHKEDYNLKLAIEFAGQSSIYDVFVVNANEKNSTLVYYLNGKGITIILIQENKVISSCFF